MSGVVFDSSVILAAILGEKGGDNAFDRIEEAVVSAVNVAEVYSYAAVNALATGAIDAFFADTGIAVEPFTREQAEMAGGMAAITRKAGLSLGDRACLSLGRLRSAEVLTADRVWASLAEELGVTITLLR